MPDACPGIREGGGAQNLKAFFFLLFNILCAAETQNMYGPQRRQYRYPKWVYPVTTDVCGPGLVYINNNSQILFFSQYICKLLNWYTPSRLLRSASTTSLVPNRNRTVRYGRRLLDTSAAALWNTMPEELRNAVNVVHFKRLLKRHFMRL